MSFELGDVLGDAETKTLQQLREEIARLAKERDEAVAALRSILPLCDWEEGEFEECPSAVRKLNTIWDTVNAGLRIKEPAP